MSNNLISFFLLVTILISGCTTTNANTGYYWGNYSGTLYALKVNPGEKALSRHINELQSIIDTSNKKGIKVPPGVHAELGYRLAQSNEKTRAKQELSNEVLTYPESKNFIERVIVFLGLGE